MGDHHTQEESPATHDATALHRECQLGRRGDGWLAVADCA